jgi:D-sedoheptulose 7-phosphate isomerase
MKFSSDVDSLIEALQALKALEADVAEVVQICVDALKAGNKVVFCGNGGSASQAQHLAAELVGRYKVNRPAMNSISLTVDTSALTAIGNDYGFDVVFARQIEGVGNAGDVLVGLSTSGSSKNVVAAFESAKRKGIKTIAFVGSKPCAMKDLADATIAVPADVSNKIQEMHLVVGHYVCGEIEKRFYSFK